MLTQFDEYLTKYPTEVVEMFYQLHSLVLDSAQTVPTQLFWAKMPTYQVGDLFVRLIPFKDHVNVEAKAVEQNKSLLDGYKVTSKGMLQIFVGQSIPTQALCKIFTETLV